MSVHIHNIIPAMHSRFEGVQPNMEIDNVSIDSRSLQNNAGTLFFALQGQNRDGHQYIAPLINKGVVNFVVSHIPADVVGKANFFVVGNTLTALQDFALYYRKLYSFPVVAITGSNGKTIVKEWLNYLLSPDYTIIRSPKSYNSQVGVALSVIGINERHNLGIFEAGISTTGEMEKLEPIIRPDIGILTNIGIAHDEGFAHREEKITEKLKLFAHVRLLILQKNTEVEALLNPLIKTFTWGNEADVDVLINTKHSGGNTVISATHNKETFEVVISFTDDASVENTAAA